MIRDPRADKRTLLRVPTNISATDSSLVSAHIQPALTVQLETGNLRNILHIRPVHHRTGGKNCLRVVSKVHPPPGIDMSKATTKTVSGAAMAATAALLFSVAPFSAASAAEAKVHCTGVNSCKGQSACKSASY